MASLQMTKSSICPLSVSPSSFPGKSVYVFSGSISSQRILRLANSSTSNYRPKCFRVRCAAQNGDKQGKGDEPPESLFMKELKRRGMNPTSLLEEYDLDDEVSSNKDAGTSSKFDQSLLNQRERSIALNSEGLEGLIPRAKLLLTIGGTFFIAFWPLIILILALFSALYFYFGSEFVHDGTETPISPPQYVDPYALLEDERISQMVPRVNSP